MTNLSLAEMERLAWAAGDQRLSLVIRAALWGDADARWQLHLTLPGPASTSKI